MRMMPSQIVKYPKLATYIQNEIPKLQMRPTVIHALMSSTLALDTLIIRKSLRWGEDPLIQVKPLSDSYGTYIPQNIYINERVIKDFESANKIHRRRGIVTIRKNPVHIVGITLLHELAHWLSDVHGSHFRPPWVSWDEVEEGNIFERLLYGKVYGVPFYEMK